MIRARRVFDKRSDEDGCRVLVDRKWPLGIRKEAAALDYWAKELAPSDELRDFFLHDPKRWSAFRARFREELKAPAALKTLAALADVSKSRTVTLLYGARESTHNAAAVVKETLEELVQDPVRAAVRPHAHSTRRRDRALLKAIKSPRLLSALVFAAVFALEAGPVRADGDQSDVISAHGDALADATSAPALVRPMPSLPPNSAPPVIPSEAAVAAPSTVAQPSPAAPSAAPAASARTAVPATRTAPMAPVAANSPPTAPAAPAAPASAPDHGRSVLISAGALLALAMFLWERRGKD